MVERAGKSIEHTVVKSCQDDKKVGQCTQRNLTYETSCQSCTVKGKKAIYIGETARSTYERGIEHSQDYRSGKPDGHMYCHAHDAHEGEDKPKFGMRILRQHKSPLYRQVHEAILISMNENIVLNAKHEYNRCLLPRLSVMIGESEDKKYSDDSNEVLTNEDEDNLEENSKRKQKTEFKFIRNKKRKVEKTMNTQESRTRKRKHHESTPCTQETPGKKPRSKPPGPKTDNFECVAPPTFGGPRENHQPTKDQVNLKKHYYHYSPPPNQLSNLTAKSNQKLKAKNLINFFENLKASNPKENTQTPFFKLQPQQQAKPTQKLRQNLLQNEIAIVKEKLPAQPSLAIPAATNKPKLPNSRTKGRPPKHPPKSKSHNGPLITTYFTTKPTTDGAPESEASC